MERTKHRRVIEIDRGLFLVRYVTADDGTRPPSVKVSSEPMSDRNVSLVLHPDCQDAVLWQPGASVVIRATTSSKLLVEVVPIDEGGSLAATVKVERLTQGDAPLRQLRMKYRGAGPYDLDEIRLVGHVASIGDVIVKANEWLAGPSAPSRIEGISMEWPGKPETVDVRYSVKTARPQTASDRMMDLGAFAGTRGKAMPVVGVTFELSGAGAADLQFNIEAIFLGSPATRLTGRRVVLSGQTGREPLVGLRVGLEEVSATAQSRPMESTGRSSRTSSGVRVFRSRPKQGQSAVL
jgi:hypothetical protein